MRLTDLAIRNLPVPERGVRVYTDDSIPGFGVRASQGGSKAFTLTYGANRERVTLGRYPIISLVEARTAAKRILAERTLGKHEPKRIAFEKALDTFVSMHCAQKNRPSTAKETERLLRVYFRPLHGKDLGKIAASDITDITDALIERGKESTAGHAFTAIRTFLRWSVRRRHLLHSPIEGLESPTRPRSRDRVLTDAELAIVLATARTGGRFGVYVQLLILTGQRKGEIAGLRVEMLDCKANLATLPAAMVKNKREHTFPFGPLAATLVGTLPQEGRLFPGRTTSVAIKAAQAAPFNGFSKAMDQFRTRCGIAHWTLHDLRRTFATGLQRLGVRLEVIEALLNHVSGSRAGIVGVYQRHPWMDEMRAAVALWEIHILSLPKPATLAAPE